MTETQNASVVRPGFSSKTVSLRPCVGADIERAHIWRELTDPQLWSVWAEPVVAPAVRAAEFEKLSADDRGAYLAAVGKVDGALVAVFRHTAFNLLNRSARLEIYWSSADGRINDVFDALTLYIGYLFRQFNLNSVHAAVVSMNSAYIALLDRLKFHRDGVLRQRHYFNNEFHDEFVYSLLRYEAHL